MLDLYGISDLAIQRAADVDRRTAQHWKRLGHVPRVIEPLMRLRLYGDLSVASDAWADWALANHRLWSPEGLGYTPDDVRSFGMLHQLTRALIAERYDRPSQQFHLPFPTSRTL